MTSILLFSGGVDSTCVACWLRPTHLLFVDYGQVAADGERRAASMIAPLLELELDEIRIDLRLLGAGSLASSAPSPHGAHPEFWPYRNQFLVSVAAARALQVGADLVMAGSVSTDDRHVDGSAAFYRQADQLVAMQEGGIHVRAPAVDMTAEALVTLAKPSDEVLSWTHSCHTGSIACGSCGGCIKRQSVLRTTERLQSDVHPK